jgi:hypothetical protein
MFETTIAVARTGLMSFPWFKIDYFYKRDKCNKQNGSSYSLTQGEALL